MVTIYALKDPETRKIRYIGQTSAPKKRLRGHLNDTLRCHRTNWIAELKSRGLFPEFEALFEVPDSEAGEWEIKTIASAKKMGLDLVNQTLGGAAPMAGKKHTPEALVKMSGVNNNNFGTKYSSERCAKMSASRKGVKFSVEHCKNLSLARIGVPNCSEEKKLRQAKEMAGTGNPYYGCFGTEHPAFGTKRPQATSAFKGVSWDRSKSRWRAVISISGKYKFIGRFKTEVEAAEAVLRWKE